MSMLPFILSNVAFGIGPSFMLANKPMWMIYFALAGIALRIDAWNMGF